jgi:hypothetical protein
MGAGCWTFLVGAVLGVIAIRALIVASRTDGAATLLGKQLQSLREEVERLEQRLLELKRSLRLSKDAAGGAPETEASAAPTPPPVPKAPAAPIAASAQVPPPLPASPATVPPLPPPKPSPAPPGPEAKPAPASGPLPPPIPPRAAPPPRPPMPPRAPRPSFDWESLVGVKLFSWIAGIALVIAAIFFLQYSIGRGWLSPPVRMTLGVLTGVVLLVLCELKAARRYPVTANALDAAAIAILFSSFFAAHALWHLIALPAVFGLMALVTVVAVLLSIRRESIFIALLGLVGGFATPALLSTGEDRPIGLFGYLLFLNAGLAWVAYRKRWPVLAVLSLVFTVFYQWSWVMTFLTASKMPLAFAIFLVFPVLGFAAFAAASRGKTEPDRVFGLTVAAGTALPLLFGVYLAAVPAFGGRFVLLFGFLFLVAAGLAAVALARRQPELLLAGGGMTLLVFVVWFARSYRSAAWPKILAIVALFVALFIGADVLARRARLAADAMTAGLTAPLLLFAFPVLVAVEPAAASPGLLFGALFLLLAGLALYAVVSERGPIYFTAAFFALAAEAVWSGRHLTRERLLPALAIYGVFALFYLGVPVLARARGRSLKPESSGAVLLLASLGLLFFLAAGPVASSALWGVGMLLAILNLGLFAEGSAGRSPALTVAGVVLSWLVLAVWWATAAVSELLVPALVVVAGLAMLAAGGSLWARRRAESVQPAAASVLGGGVYLGLAGHLFLLFVASQKALAVPPWPLLGVLFALDLALGAAALAAGRGELILAALSASQIILTVFAVVAGAAPWPAVALAAALGVGLMGLGFFGLGRRLVVPGRAQMFAAAAAALLGEGVLLAAVWQPGTPSWPALAVWQAAVLAALLLAAAAMEWHGLAIVAIAPAAAAIFLWREAHFRAQDWSDELSLAAAAYAVFLAYPLVLGRRARAFREPYVAAVVAGVPFFFLARHAILAGPWAGAIGALPVTQAALMVILVVRLLRLEPAGQRLVPRLATVAAAALAFLTVAIPLQLEKQWITIGFALETAALSWLYGKLKHRGLLLWATGLAAAVFVRLALNRAVLSYYSRQGPPIWNWYLYSYVVAAAALFLAAWFLKSTDDRLAEGMPRASVLLPAAATVLLFLVLNIEIADAYSTGQTIAFNFSAGLAQDLTYTIGWALFAIALLVAGIARKSRATRIASLVLLVVTIFKCFVHDLWQLGGLYRVGSFVGLAVCLALVALALQKFVLARDKEKV